VYDNDKFDVNNMMMHFGQSIKSPERPSIMLFSGSQTLSLQIFCTIACYGAHGADVQACACLAVAYIGLSLVIYCAMCGCCAESVDQHAERAAS